MKVASNLSYISPFFLLIIMNVASIGGLKIPNSAETEMNSYLYSKMLEYERWIKDNQLDPSPPTNTSIVLKKRESGRVYLDCEISKQFTTGQSQQSNPLIIPESSFEYHLFAVQYEQRRLIELTGIFNCSGKLIHQYYDDLEEDLDFTGQGKFKAIFPNSVESIFLINVGLTSEYKLDFTHSLTGYGLSTGIKYVELRGDWDKEEINAKYINDVQITFRSLYRLFLSLERNHTNLPSGLLMERYFREILEVDIRDIISEENLPPPFVPTP